jgi:hypothetical protein
MNSDLRIGKREHSTAQPLINFFDIGSLVQGVDDDSGMPPRGLGRGSAHSAGTGPGAPCACGFAANFRTTT